jgi:multiple antibiotic resistance protein
MPIGIADIVLIFLITIGPLKALIVYATLAGGADAALRRQIAFRTVMVATIVALLFVVAGEVLLQVFHISLAALKIAGGIILLLFALGMVMGGGHGNEGEKPKAVSLDIAVYPLAMPMMATPQGLVAITVATAAMTAVWQIIVVAVIVLAIMGLNLVCMLAADRIIKALGPSTLQIVAKIAGLLLSALAVQLMILGLTDLGLIEGVAGQH